MSAQSAKVNYVGGQHSSAVNRHAQRTADDSAAFLLPYLDKLAPSFKLLDLGCGPGSITTDLAKRYPHATFTGIDGGEKQIQRAKEIAVERGLSNAVFQVGDILKLDDLIEWGTFDVVYCHQVLTHMQLPVEGMKVMKRAAKPHGGLVAAREADLAGGQILWPETPGVRGWSRLLHENMLRNGSSVDFGRRLVSTALKAGFSRSQVTATVSANTFDTLEGRVMFGDSVASSMRDPSSTFRNLCIDQGLATSEELEEYAKGVEEWRDAEDSFYGSFNAEAVCRNG